MTTRPPEPGEPGRPGHESGPPGPVGPVDLQRAKLATLWTLVLDRFLDYLDSVTMVTDDPRLNPGGSHDPDA